MNAKYATEPMSSIQAECGHQESQSTCPVQNVFLTRPHKDKPMWLLSYFAPMHKFGESYREEIGLRRSDARQARNL